MARPRPAGAPKEPFGNGAPGQVRGGVSPQSPFGNGGACMCSPPDWRGPFAADAARTQGHCPVSHTPVRCGEASFLLFFVSDRDRKGGRARHPEESSAQSSVGAICRGKNGRGTPPSIGRSNGRGAFSGDPTGLPRGGSRSPLPGEGAAEASVLVLPCGSRKPNDPRGKPVGFPMRQVCPVHPPIDLPHPLQPSRRGRSPPTATNSWPAVELDEEHGNILEGEEEPSRHDELLCSRWSRPAVCRPGCGWYMDPDP
jgi:hypothetical protein